MSLDTKQRRGSAISVGLPWRNWVSDPSEVIDFGDRLSFAHYASASGGVEIGGFRICGTIRVEPAMTGSVTVTPLLTGETSVSPMLTGTLEVDCDCGEC